jgi:hypothetical protein
LAWLQAAGQASWRSRASTWPSRPRGADSLEEAGEALFAFTRLPPSQWKSARTTNAIEQLDEEFKRRIKTQTVLPSAETAAMLLWALLATGQTSMRKIDGWQSLGHPPAKSSIDLAARADTVIMLETAQSFPTHPAAAPSKVWSYPTRSGRVGPCHMAVQTVWLLVLNVFRQVPT